jgi:hypothetical protein
MTKKNDDTPIPELREYREAITPTAEQRERAIRAIKTGRRRPYPSIEQPRWQRFVPALVAACVVVALVAWGLVRLPSEPTPSPIVKGAQDPPGEQLIQPEPAGSVLLDLRLAQVVDGHARPLPASGELGVGDRVVMSAYANQDLNAFFWVEAPDGERRAALQLGLLRERAQDVEAEEGTVVYTLAEPGEHRFILSTHREGPCEEPACSSVSLTVQPLP